MRVLPVILLNQVVFSLELENCWRILCAASIEAASHPSVFSKACDKVNSTFASELSSLRGAGFGVLGEGRRITSASVASFQCGSTRIDRKEADVVCSKFGGEKRCTFEDSKP